MKTFYNILLVPFLFLSIYQTDLNGQDSKQHVVFFDMVQLIGINNFSFDFGYTLDLENKFAHTFEFGIILPEGKYADIEKLGPGRRKGNGFELRYMPKYQFNDSYIGFETAYVNHNYQSHRWLLNSSDIVYAYDVKLNEFASYLSLGTIISESGSYIDISLSLGVRFQNVINNSTSPLSSFSFQRRLSNYIEVEDNGWHRLLGIRLSTKIGFVMPKFK